MDAEELKKRTKIFALRVLRLAAALPNPSRDARSGGNWSELGRRELQGSMFRSIQSRIHREAGNRSRRIR